jgi:hypothetical protein
MSSLLDSQAVGITLAFALTGILAVSRWKGSPSLPYPPGPAPDPIIGNARAMGSDELERVFAAWGKKYGVSHLLCLTLLHAFADVFRHKVTLIM